MKITVVRMDPHAEKPGDQYREVYSQLVEEKDFDLYSVILAVNMIDHGGTIVLGRKMMGDPSSAN
jgi:succinate dehydrogenase flavin-adding protein (antitoxin of CptAB toxin-antitoxin module)